MLTLVVFAYCSSLLTGTVFAGLTVSGKYVKSSKVYPFATGNVSPVIWLTIAPSTMTFNDLPLTNREGLVITTLHFVAAGNKAANLATLSFKEVDLATLSFMLITTAAVVLPG
jgi:hypothetical protein